ncbi:GNAT family N-acetyltransferase [Roseateles cellulosilyticus]|uniref:GNAT family N-acetyltransferase n=1 Tax=Pelomonas cellulosilytica TaxID=2906762 RepID=A0ABS8XZY9_9BURK|nr:GNAT family protein [Pelomonas sp. P8]MCE4556825.1 GNAT family N-acetyltransferase [Pelomonas sp. P8]
MNRELHTDRLWLRAPRPGDEHAAFERWASSTEQLRWMGWAAHTTTEQTRQWLAWEQARWQKKSGFTWMLLSRHRADTGPVGLVQLLPQRLDGPAHHLRLGYVMAADWQRQGLMREALRAVLDHAFTQEPVWRVDALVDVDNAPSRALMESMGLACEGRLHRHLRRHEPGEPPRDVWVYARWREAPGDDAVR